MDDFSFYDFGGMSGFGGSNPRQNQLADGERVFVGWGGEDGESSNPPPSSTEEESEFDNQQPSSPEEEPPDAEYVVRDGGQSEMIEGVKEALVEGKNLLIECPPGFERRSVVLKIMLHYRHWLKSGMNLDGMDFVDKSKTPVPSKIFVGTRNFNESQKVLREIHDEIGPTKLLRNIKISLLDHRKNLCVNENVTNNNTSAATINLSCRKCVHQCNQNIPSTSKKCREDVAEGPICEFYQNSMQASADPLPLVVDSPFGHTVHDMEDFIIHCRGTSRCPYIDTRHLARNADLIVCPMEFLLSPALRLEYEIKLDNAIVLMDDGYNLEDLCRNEATISMSLADLRRTSGFVENITQDFQKREGEEDAGLNTLNDFLSMFSQWVVSNTHAQPEDILETLREFNVDAINFAELLKYLIEALQSAAPVISEQDSESIEKVCKFISTLYLVVENMDTSSFSVELSQVPSENNRNRPETVFRIVCADPSVVLKPIDCITNSIIVSSSCLAPYQPFLELGIPFGEPLRIVPESYLKNRLLVLYTDQGPNGVEFTLNFRMRKSPKVIRETGCALLEICKVVPKGKIALFHSYEHMKMTCEHWEKTQVAEQRGTIIEEIRSVTKVFSELDMKTEPDMERLMTEFKAAARTKEGAMLLALTRGKLYENWDINFENVHGIVHISMPFGPFWHPNIVAKREFLEKKYNDENCLQKAQHYHKEAFRRENRSFCCCIKDIRRDHGVVIILDSRMAAESHEFGDTMPCWIKHPTNCRNFDSLISKVVDKMRQLPDDDNGIQ